MDELQTVAQVYGAAHNALAALYWLGVLAVGCVAAGLAIIVKRGMWP